MNVTKAVCEAVEERVCLEVESEVGTELET
jgi:hypothetical protein